MTLHFMAYWMVLLVTAAQRLGYFNCTKLIVFSQTYIPLQ